MRSLERKWKRPDSLHKVIFLGDLHHPYKPSSMAESAHCELRRENQNLCGLRKNDHLKSNIAFQSDTSRQLAVTRGSHRRAGSAAWLQGLVALSQQVPPCPEEPGVLGALAGELLYLGRHSRRRLQDLRQREGRLEKRQSLRVADASPAPAPEALVRGRPTATSALTSPICISTSSSSSRVPPAGRSGGWDTSLPSRTLCVPAAGTPSGTAVAISRSAQRHRRAPPIER